MAFRPRLPDWHCHRCSMMVFGSKDQCSKCFTRNPGLVAFEQQQRQQQQAQQQQTIVVVPAAAGGSPSDWRCPGCNFSVFGSKPCCPKCGTARASLNVPSQAPLAATPTSTGGAQPQGDWCCPSCSFLVFGSKSCCPKCSTTRSGGVNSAAVPVMAAQPSSRPKLPDWPCKVCNVIVFGSKAGCSRCDAPNPGFALAAAASSASGDSPADVAAAVAALARRERELLDLERAARDRARELEQKLAQRELADACTTRVAELRQEVAAAEQRLANARNAEEDQSFSSFAPPPPYWTAELGFKMVPLTDDHELSRLAVLMNQCDAPGNVSVVKAFRVQNPRLWVQYCTQRHFLEQDKPKPLVVTPIPMMQLAAMPPADQVPSVGLLRREANEVYGFHGTKPEFIDTICREGFDERVGALGGLFGAGVYFADRVKKSHGYTGVDSKTNLRPIFISRVALGRMTDPTTNHRSNERRAPQGFDSVCGQATSGAAHEFIVYDRRQTYPEFLVWYATR